MLSDPRDPADPKAPQPASAPRDQGDAEAAVPPETGGRKGPDPVRYGDWEKNGRCIDF